MGKIITVLLLTLMLSINGLAQSAKTTRIFGQDIADDAINHTTLCFIVGGAVTAQMYGWTGKKWLSTGVGILVPVLGGLVKEHTDPTFSERDMRNNTYGAIAGSFTAHFIINGPRGVRNNIKKRKDRRRKRRLDKGFININ